MSKNIETTLTVEQYSEMAKAYVRETAKRDNKNREIQNRTTWVQDTFNNEDLFSDWSYIERIYFLTPRREDPKWIPVDLKTIIGLVYQMCTEYSIPKDSKYKRLAGAIIGWFDFTYSSCYNADGEIVIIYGGDILYPERKEKRAWHSWFYNETGLIPTNEEGKTVIEIVLNKLALRATITSIKPCIYNDAINKTIYISTRNSSDVIVISPDEIKIIKNGDDGMIFNNINSKIEPFELDEKVNLKKTADKMNSFFRNVLSCSYDKADFIKKWFCCFLFAPNVSTRPLLRFEGAAGSGKTNAQKIITTVLYGSAQQKRSTNAANYSDGAVNPLIALDQVETVNVNQSLTDFLLMSATGTRNEKRKHGSDTEIISEKISCLVCTSGIEPLRGDLNEISSRSFVIDFVLPEQVVIESDMVGEAISNRDAFMSYIIMNTQKMLKANINDIMQSLPKHSKYRCNEYLAYMYLFDNIDHKPGDEIDHRFSGILESFTVETESSTIYSNNIVVALTALFEEYKSYNDEFNREAVEGKYMCRISDIDISLNKITLTELFFILNRVSKMNHLQWPYKTPQQFIQRFYNDLPIIEKSGMSVESYKIGGNKKNFTIKYGGRNDSEVFNGFED